MRPMTQPTQLRVPSARGVFLVTALTAFMASLDLSIVNIAFPALERSFPHDPRSSLAWVITAYAIAFGALLVVAGRTADRVGARRVFAVGMVVFCVGSALCGGAPSLSLLVAGRTIQGAGAAAMLPSALGLLIASVGPAVRTQTVARWSGVAALAVATGPTLGALLVTGAGWRWIFLVNLPIGAALLVWGRRHLPTTVGDHSRAAPDYLGAALVSAALGGVVLAITEGPTWGWTSPRVVGVLIGAVALAGWFLRRSSRHPAPVLDLTLFRARTVAVANGAMVLYATGFFAMLLGNILFLTAVWHYTILEAGLAVTPGPLVVAAVAGRAGRLAQRVGFRPVLLVGAAVLGVALAGYAVRVGTRPDYLGVWLPSTLLAGLGIGCTFPVLGATAVASLREDRYAVGSALHQTARQVGGAVGVALLVVLVGGANAAPSLGGLRHLWWFCAAAALGSGAVCAALPRGAARPALAPVAVAPAD